jgi:hypothetical protein
MGQGSHYRAGESRQFVICYSHTRRLVSYTIHVIADLAHGDVVEGHIADSGRLPYLTTSSGQRGTIVDQTGRDQLTGPAALIRRARDHDEDHPENEQNTA